MKTFISQQKMEFCINNLFKGEKGIKDFKDAYARGFRTGVDKTREVRNHTVVRLKTLELENNELKDENKALYARIEELERICKAFREKMERFDPELGEFKFDHSDFDFV